MKFLLGVLLTVFVAIVGIFIVVTSGVINIGADQAHSPLVYNFLEAARTRSIANASKDIAVPNLEKTEMISSGGADYKDMCAGCHLSPGVESTDFSASLYPKPPNFIKQMPVLSKPFGPLNTVLWHQVCPHGALRTMMIECGQWSLLSDRYLN